MDLVLAGLKWRSCLVYLDEVLVFTKGDVADHLRDLTDLFSRLREHHLRAQPSKCVLFRKQLVYLGHIVCADGLRPDPRLLQEIDSSPVPRTVHQVQSFLGLAGYYRA